jgi:hypothetical protein
MQFVLDGLEKKLQGFLIMVGIVGGKGEKLSQLAVKDLFRATDVPNAGQQFVKFERFLPGKCGQAHEGQFGIGPPGDNFRRGMAVGGIMDFILHHLKELLRFRRVRVIVNAGGVQIKHLTVQLLFAGADVADALQEFPPVIAAPCLFQEVVVHGKTLDEILPQNRQRPTAELGAA